MSGLQGALSTETSARSDADTALQANIDAEAAARTGAVSSEASTRSAADDALVAMLAALDGSLAAVAKTGSYSDLANKPDLSIYAQTANLPWRTTGTYIAAAIAGIGATSVDQSTTPTGGAGAFSAAIWQSFTPSLTGVLSAMNVGISGSVTAVTVSIRSGEGMAGTVLFSQAMTVTGNVDIPITGVDVVAGQKYTVVLEKAAAYNWLFNLGSTYAGGTLGTTNGPVTGFDIAFKAIVAVQPGVAVTSGGNIGLGTSTPTAQIDVSGGAIRIRTSRSPASNATCAKGEIAWDQNFVYVCIATNTWRRSGLAPY
ncbi:MAG: hypothetical protein U1F43_14045 [Myxococcota bacterium]